MLLLLAGTAEARGLARELAKAGIPAVASLAGVTRVPAELDIATRIGGFGGGDQFSTYLNDKNISAIVDATHPFAKIITRRTATIARRMGLAHLQLLRPAWRRRVGDRWTMIAREEEAVRIIPPGATVFLGTGRQTLSRFANLKGRRLICRQIDPPDAPFPFANGQYVVARPPFSVPDEIALLQKHRIDWLVVKNAGGVLSRTKLTAAARLGIPVVMIRRPALPRGKRVQTVAAAMEWIDALK